MNSVEVFLLISISVAINFEQVTELVQLPRHFYTIFELTLYDLNA